VDLPVAYPPVRPMEIKAKLTPRPPLFGREERGVVLLHHASACWGNKE